MSISAPGKVILSGEHAVVYGYPAIATAIDIRLSLQYKCLTVDENADLCYNISFSDFHHQPVILHRRDFDFNPLTGDSDCLEYFINKAGKLLESPNPPDYLTKSVACILLSRHLISSEYGLSLQNDLPFELRFSSSIPMGAGLGSSGAFCSVVAAFFLLISGVISGPELSLSDRNRIFAFANELERIFHVSPSGVDTWISTFGGAVCFRKSNDDKMRFESNGSIKVVVINTNLPRSTANVVQSVRRLRTTHPELCQRNFDVIAAICANIHRLLQDPFEESTYGSLASLFSQNQVCLRELGVSNEMIDDIVARLKTLGFGAKLTGAGRGGCVIAMPAESTQMNGAVAKVTRLLEDVNVSVFEARLCSPGVEIKSP